MGEKLRAAAHLLDFADVMESGDAGTFSPAAVQDIRKNATTLILEVEDWLRAGIA